MVLADRTPNQELLEQAILYVSKEYNADIFLLVGRMSDELGHGFIDLCPSAPEVQNCILMMTTSGGDLEAAYRITRCIQDRYAGGNVFLFTNSLCKSAGTLVALGADILIMTDYAELGPLDTQVMVRDEFGEYQSGLIDTDALRILREEVFTNFRGQLDALLSLGGGNFTTQTASRIASELTLGLFGGIYSQINPIRFGERGRAVQVALEYGQRVSSSNVKEGALARLTTGYPSHSFVIDRREAGELFHDVFLPDERLSVLSELLHPVVNYLYTSDFPVLEYLSQGISDHLARLIEVLGSNEPESGQGGGIEPTDAEDSEGTTE